jgi:hypothetical protein
MKVQFWLAAFVAASKASGGSSEWLYEYAQYRRSGSNLGVYLKRGVVIVSRMSEMT